MDSSQTPEPALSGDAIQALVANHRTFLSFLERRVGDRALAEDILQQAFIKGVERIDSLNEEGAVVAWFYRTLRNAVIDAYRRKGAQSRGLESFARELESTTEPPPDTSQAVCQCVGSLARTLKPEYALALQRIEIDGVSVQGYAAEAGIAAGNAAVRVHRARAALRERVIKSCGTCAEHGCLDCTCGRP
jgi:RNA polymerase sigma-70 factor (ECF subfamily)